MLQDNKDWLAGQPLTPLEVMGFIIAAKLPVFSSVSWVIREQLSSRCAGSVHYISLSVLNSFPQFSNFYAKKEELYCLEMIKIQSKFGLFTEK